MNTYKFSLLLIALSLLAPARRCKAESADAVMKIGQCARWDNSNCFDVNAATETLLAQLLTNTDQQWKFILKNYSISELAFDRVILVQGLPIVVLFYSDQAEDAMLTEQQRGAFIDLAKRFENKILFVPVDVSALPKLAYLLRADSKLPYIVVFAEQKEVGRAAASEIDSAHVLELLQSLADK